MRILEQMPHSNTQETRETKGRKPKFESSADAPYMSPDEIRQKLAAHKSEKVQVNRAAKKSGIISDMPDDLEKRKDHLLQSDIGQNDPTSIVTQEKLKDLVQSGGFNFNPKEREVLKKILS